MNSACQPQPQSTLDIMYSADIHGQVETLPYFATTVKQYRAAHPKALLLDAGDWAHGSALSDRFQGQPVIDIMNELGYEAAGVGEGDLHWGLGPFLERVRQARFPILAANLQDASGQPLAEVPSHTVIERDGLCIAVIGLCCAQCERAGETRVGQPYEALLETLYLLRRQSIDLTIVLSHLGLEQDRLLAKNVAAITCILGGHSHIRMESPQTVGSTIIAHCGQNARQLGTLQLHTTTLGEEQSA